MILKINSKKPSKSNQIKRTQKTLQLFYIFQNIYFIEIFGKGTRSEEYKRLFYPINMNAGRHEFVTQCHKLILSQRTFQKLA